VQPERLGIQADLSPLSRFGAIAIYEFVRPTANLQAAMTTFS
jgi:hypothetical protein